MLTDMLDYRWGGGAVRRRRRCVAACLAGLLAVGVPAHTEETGEPAVAAETQGAEPAEAVEAARQEAESAEAVAVEAQASEPANAAVVENDEVLPPDAVYDPGHPRARDDGFVVPIEGGDDFSYLDLIARMGLGLGLVMLLAWGAAALVRRSGLSQQMGAAGGAVRVVDRTFLAPKKAVYLVNIGGRTLALGVTESQISRLAEWPEGEVDLQPVEKPGGGAAFRQLFKQVRQRRSEQ